MLEGRREPRREEVHGVPAVEEMREEVPEIPLDPAALFEPRVIEGDPERHEVEANFGAESCN